MLLVGWRRVVSRRRAGSLRVGRPSGRPRASAVAALVLTVSVFAGCSGGTEPEQAEGSYGRAQPYSALPAYSGAEWADRLQAEQYEYLDGLREVPDGGFESDDFDGEFIEVRDGVRWSAGTTCDCPVVTLWLTGGSAAFGIGQRGEHTIASELVRLAAADGVALEVQNQGVPGRTLWNEYQDVERRIEQDGQAPPDMIVSYGGFNDAVGALGSAAVGELDPDVPNQLDNGDFARWGEQGFAPPADATARQVADLTIDRFRRAQGQFDALAARHGVDVAYVFQPDALASSTQFGPVADVWTQVPARIADQVDDQLEAVSVGLGGSVRNLRHLHDDDAPLFADWAHANEAGARAAAEDIYRTIRPELLDRARR